MAFRNRLNVLKSNKILAILVVVILLIIALVILAITNRLHLIASLIISCIAASCAIISAALASQSLKKTEEALELTRITMRPYLAVQPGDVGMPLNQKEHIMTFEFHVKNTGPVPANLVTAEMALFDASEVIEDDNESKFYEKDYQHPPDVVVFPDAVYNLRTIVQFRPDIGKGLLDNKANTKVSLRFRITYSAQGIEYITIQTEKLERIDARTLRRVPIQPQKWT